MKVLYCAIGFCKETNEQRMKTFSSEQQTETRIQMIKMVNKFKLTVVHFASPNLMQICACGWIYRWTKNCGKSGPGLRAAGPSRAVGRGSLGFRAARPLSRSGPWAVGRWAAGLLLAKPSFNCCWSILLFSKTQKGEKCHEIITSVLFQAPHEHN